MRLEWSIHDEAVQKAFDKMTAAQIRPILRTGTRKGMLVVRRQVVANYKKAFPGSQKWRAIWAKNYAKKNRIGAYISLHKLNPKYDIGNPRLLRWLDLGTYERETKMGYNRGAMGDTNFFGKAVEATVNQAEAVASKYINEGLVKKGQKLGLV